MDKHDSDRQTGAQTPESSKKKSLGLVLNLHVNHAQNLRKNKLGTNSYVVVKFRKSDGRVTNKNWRSQVFPASTNPQWDFLVKTHLRSNFKDLIIEVRDTDHKSGQDWLGDVIIDDISSQPKKFDGCLPLGPRYDPNEKVAGTPQGEISISWRIVGENESNHAHYHSKIRSQFVGRSVSGTGPKIDDRIVIVGAGPAGIHMAHLLTKKGYKNLTILEGESSVGGKSYTVTMDDIPHEMGTCFLHPLYIELDKLIREYNKCAEEYAPGDAQTSDREVYVKDPDLSAPNVPIGREEYLYGYAEKLTLPKNFWFLPDSLMKGTVFSHIRRYRAIHKQIFGDYDYTVPPKPTPQMMEKMNITLGEFLKVNDMEALIPLFNMAHVAQGYGLLQTMPAFYGLWWLTPKLLYSILPPPIGKNPRGTPLLTMLKQGYKTVWETIYKTLKLNVIFNFEVTSIERLPDKVLIDGKENSQPIKQKLEFDYLIITIPLKESLKIFKPPTPQETDIFSRLKCFTLTTTLYESDRQKDHKQIIQYYVDLLHPDYPGEVYAQRHSARCLYGAATFNHAKDVYVAYQFCDSNVKMDHGSLKKKFLENMKERGVTGIKIYLQIPWKYFYHFGQQDIMDGYPWMLLDLQGTNRTLYAGSSACFESVNDVLNYNIMLVSRFMNQ